MLKYKFSKEEFDKLDENLQALYTLKGDVYILQAEGIADRTKLEEFRTSNEELLKANKGLDGINMEKYNSMLDLERKVRDKELIDKGDFETLITERMATAASDFTAKLATASAATDSVTSKYNTLLDKHVIEGAAMKAFGISKIRPDATNAILAQIKAKFSTDDNGNAIAKDGDTILAGVDGNLTIAEFVESQPAFMRVPNTPGHGDGGDETPASINSGKTSVDKIASGLTALRAGKA